MSLHFSFRLQSRSFCCFGLLYQNTCAGPTASRFHAHCTHAVVAKSRCEPFSGNRCRTGARRVGACAAPLADRWLCCAIHSDNGVCCTAIVRVCIGIILGVLSCVLFVKITVFFGSQHSCRSPFGCGFDSNATCSWLSISIS